MTIEGPLLVLAGAGTGKTRVVTVRIANLLAKQVAPENILAVTFTNKAAAEMRERVASLVGKAGAKALTISTFHSFALRLLRRYGDRLGYRKNFGISDDEDKKLLLRTSLRDLGISEKEVPPRWGLQVIGGWKNAGLDCDGAMEAAADDAEIKLAFAYRRLHEEMKKRQVVDFDDMLSLTSRLFSEHPDVLDQARDRWRYLMVDEYQDTNAIQLGLIRSLAGPRRNLAVVGDDDQSIYGWRGAEPGNILNFSRQFPGAKVVTLDQNYRSTNRILRTANAVISNNRGRLEKKLWSAHGEGDKIEFYTAADEREELTRMMVKLNERVQEGAAWRDLAILFRANAQSNALELRLRERGIPYKIVGTYSLFDRREVRDVLAYLRVLANPKDDGALFRILNRPSRGIGNGTRDKLSAEAVEQRCGVYDLIRDGGYETLLRSAAVERVAEFAALMAEVAEAAEQRGVHAAMECLYEKVGFRAFLEIEAKDPAEVEVRWNILQLLLEMAERHDASTDKGLAAFLEKIFLDQQQDDRKEKTDASDAVTLMTVHAAKGLEFPHVYMVGVEEGLFPHKNSFADDDADDTIDEERRLFYVAITRARLSLSMSMASERRRWGRDEKREESRFLTEFESDDITFVDASTDGPADTTTAGSYLDRMKNLFADN